MFASLLLAGSAAYAQGPTAFNTSITNYVYVGSSGLNASSDPSLIYTSASAAGPSFTGGTAITGASSKVNGIGLNQADGFLYGISFPGVAASGDALLYRIGANGVAQQLGTIQAPTSSNATKTFINTTAGFVDAGGNYWFSAYLYTGNPAIVPYQAQFLKFYIGKVPNVGTLPASTSANLTPVYNEVAYQADLGFRTGVQSFLNNFNYADPGASNGGFEDIAISPLDGKLYTYYSYPNPSSPNQLLHRPAVVNPTTWTATTVGTTVNSAPNREIAGAYFDPAGNFYVLFTNAQYSKVNLTTGALEGLTTTSLPLAGGSNLRGDLASNLPNANPLPVRLVSFDAYSNGSTNVLQWRTALEESMDGYEVERSDDEQSFFSIGYVPATGKGGEYRFEDARGGSALYRLRIRNADGTPEFSPVARIAVRSGDAAAAVVYPTLITGDELNIRAAGEFRVRVVNAEGRLITTGSGNGSLTLPFAMAPGQYVVTVTGTDGQQIATVRVVRP